MSERHRHLDDLVVEVTPRVLDEALEAAVDRAREELAEVLARAIVDRATRDGAVAGAASPAQDRPAQDRPEATDAAAATATPGTGLYAFAIVPAGPVDLAGVAGIDGAAPLRIVQHHDLGLVVSEMRLDLMDDVSEDDLTETGALATLARRHDEVVRGVFDHGPVLPLRFGTVVADEEGARRLLEDQATDARARLEHLAARREWGVRLSRDTNGAAAQAEAQDETAARAERHAHSGTSYLASRREALRQSQRAEQQTSALTRRVEDTLGEHCADRANRGGGPGSGLLADLTYLVPTGDEEAFLAAAERLGTEVADEGLKLEVTGPWPPYSFATLGSDARTGVVGSA